MKKIECVDRYAFKLGEVILVKDNSRDEVYSCESEEEAKEFCNNYDGDVYYSILGGDADTHMLVVDLGISLYSLVVYDYETANGKTKPNQPEYFNGTTIAISDNIIDLQEKAKKELSPKVIKMRDSAGVYYLHKDAWEIVYMGAGEVEDGFYPNVKN